MGEFYLVKDTLFNEPEDLHDLETDPALDQDVNMVLAGPPYHTRRARGQASSAHDVFCKKNIEGAVRHLKLVMVLEAHGHLSLFRPSVLSSKQQSPSAGGERTKNDS